MMDGVGDRPIKDRLMVVLIWQAVPDGIMLCHGMGA